MLGVTVCCASGDDGSSDGEDGAAHVDFPASSPHVLACGGTRLQSSGGTDHERGRVEPRGAERGERRRCQRDRFPLPAYQASAKVPVSVNPPFQRARGSGCGRRRRSGQRATRFWWMAERGFRRHERGRAVMGRPNRLAESAVRDAARLFVTPPLYGARPAGCHARYHLRE